jgi:hypothetical protein
LIGNLGIKGIKGDKCVRNVQETKFDSNFLFVAAYKDQSEKLERLYVHILLVDSINARLS